MLKQVCEVKTNTINISTILKVSIIQVTYLLNPDGDILYFNERFARNEFQVMVAELYSKFKRR